MNPELAQAIVASATRLGVDPVDIATAMSYETAGKFSPSMWGGAGKNYLGLIQFGPEERKKYGVHEGQSVGDQVVSAENFLRDRGVKPGMGLLDIYSTINAGSPGLYSRSDANNGGTPGTVADKVRDQMAGHRVNALRLLGGQAGMIQQAPSQAPNTIATPPTAGGVASTSPPAASAAPAPVIDDTLMTQLKGISQMLQNQQASQQYAPAPEIPGNMRARMAAIAAARQLG